VGNALSHIRWKEIILPLLTVLVVAMIIFPLPSSILDILLAANFAFCIVLLLSSLFISEPDKFTSLPTLLLLSTLFRLGLNISSTRVILSGVPVPDVITAFGNFVVAGSTIVGLVVFSIISIIQFIVVAKGSERVAEVAARFTLDALPGKQMSIDADMRAGLLNLSEAREKRRELHRESKLYGALDGAMKFVKGDAIVGLCIIFVNIVAGFIVGVTRDGLPLMHAVEKYTLLTIGDGLVSQIPAVLVSVAAGIVVTRVSEREGGVLYQEIASQLFKEPSVLLISGVVLFALGFVPGLPFIPFSLVSSMPIVAWLMAVKRIDKEEQKKPPIPFSPRILPVIVIKLSAKGAFLLQRENSITGYIEAIRSEVFDMKGILLPDVCFDVDPAQSGIFADLLINSQSRGRVHFDADQNVNREDDPWSRVLGRLLKNMLNKHLCEFVDDSHTRALLDLYEVYHLDVINAVVPEKISITGLTLVLRNLVEESISIRDFACILQSLAEYFQSIGRSAPTDGGDREVFEAVRAIRKGLVPKFIAKEFPDDIPLSVFTLDMETEERLVTHIEADLSIHPDVSDGIRENILARLKSNNFSRLVILVHSRIRGVLYPSIKSISDSLIVISYEEVPSSYKIEVVGTISCVQKEVLNEGVFENAA